VPPRSCCAPDAQLAATPSAPSLRLLELFAYGTWSEYKGSELGSTPLNEAQTAKLKKLTVVSLASQSKKISYDVLKRELDM
jgi:COP9 signalosome complex subunit 7